MKQTYPQDEEWNVNPIRPTIPTTPHPTWRLSGPKRIAGLFAPWPCLTISWIPIHQRHPRDGWWIWIQFDWIVWQVAWAYDPHDDRTLFKCRSFNLGKVLRVHWHVGYHQDSKPTDPRIRLRSIHLFGWKVPVKCYID